jgi:hypothetical protein
MSVGDKVRTRNGNGIVKAVDDSNYSITMLDVLLTDGPDKGEKIYIPESSAVALSSLRDRIALAAVKRELGERWPRGFMRDQMVVIITPTGRVDGTIEDYRDGHFIVETAQGIIKARTDELKARLA